MKETFIIIGEGPTEYFFLTSLKDEFRTLQNIEPQYPKHTSMAELELKIKNAIDQGYNHVYCMIDLDNKKEGKEKTDYVNLKKKYHGKHISKPKKGIDCHIEFFETERCTELFFLYYFKYTTKLYNHSNEVEQDLNKQCGYAKTQDFFRKHPLHQYFTKQGGSIYEAIKNAEKSMETAAGRGYTFSELGKMFKKLKMLKHIFAE